MDKTTTSDLVQENGSIGNNASPETREGKTQAKNNHKRAVRRGLKSSELVGSKKYSLRSSHGNVRVLRSMSNTKNKAPIEPVSTPVQPAAKRRKRGRPSKGSPKNEYLKIRQRVRYILNRMSYEQSLIEAYASEGWKGQSLEKIRPEKELERAKAEILRCKLRIREAFQNIDSLLSEGKIEESLFDSAGEISSEDIFCATCGSKDVTLSNDIILCDGVCDRGFHQNCLNPPLRTEDIPPGDKGWLCPACDCKIECIDVLNELQGSGLSISDSWEKVFPEAAALANGPKPNDVSDLPSDDSEDNDYDPNMAEGHPKDQEERESEESEDEGSGSDDSDFITSSEDAKPSKSKMTGDDLGLPSEDSEDDDYDPADPNPDKDIQKEQSSSDESDFTSDSDDFCAEISKSCGQDEVSTPSLLGVKAVDHTGNVGRSTIDTQHNEGNSYVTNMEAELSQDTVLPVLARRQIERLDYKKLYDEAYGEASSDSSDDEEWSGKSTPQEGNKEVSETDSLESLNPAQKNSRKTRVGNKKNGHTPQSVQQSFHPDAFHGSVSEHYTGELTTNGRSSTARKKHFGPIINQRLHEHFKTDPYPSRETKETLAQELGLTSHQVGKWFASTRHYTKVAAAKGKNLENHGIKKRISSTVASMHGREPEERAMEKLIVGRNDIAPEQRMAENPNDHSKQDSLVRQDVFDEQRVALTPPRGNLSYATTSREAGQPNSGFRENQSKGTSRNVGRPKGRSLEKQIPGLELVDEARKKAILRELRKRKMSR